MLSVKDTSLSDQPPKHTLLQESEDEQLARAIAASLGQDVTSSAAAATQPPSQVAAAPKQSYL